MNVAFKLLSAVCEEQNVQAFLRVNNDWLEGDELAVQKFMNDHYRKFDEFPSRETVEDKFGIEFDKTSSFAEHLLDEVRERFVYTQITANMPKLMKQLSRDAFGTADKMKELLGGLSRPTGVRDILYNDAALERWKAYQNLVGTKGVVNVSSGIPLLDDLTFGYWQTDLWTLGGRSGTKKCHGKGTKIRMADGSIKNVEDVIVGDKLMGDDGSPRKVLKLYNGREMMYWVHQKKGDSYRVNKNHILSLKDCRTKAIRETVGVRKRKYLGCELPTKEVVNISVKEYLEKSDWWKRKHQGYKAVLNFKAKSVEIDPYFLGVWLGDGSQRELSITTVNKDILRYLYEVAEYYGLHVTPATDKITYALSGTPGVENDLMKAFRSYNLFYNKRRKKGVDDGGKHIPKQYLTNSREIRLQLLAGLLDTDGCYARDDNYFTITQKRKNLAEDIAFLARGLGFQASFKQHTAKLKSRDYECEVYTVIISGDLTVIPTKVKGKKARKRLMNKDPLLTGITVVKDKIDDFYGFEIDGNHLYCLEDLTVTHNTWSLIWMALQCEAALKKEDGPVVIITNEISEQEFVQRVDAVRFQLNYERFLRGELNAAEKQAFRDGLEDIDGEESKLIILHNLNTMPELEEKIRLYSPSVIKLDGSYLMYPEMEEGIQKTTFITRNLKALAKDTRTPIVNTTQMRKKTGKGESKHMLSGQDDFYYGSYIQDSDFAIRTYTTADMDFRQQVGWEFVKGRRIAPDSRFVLTADLIDMEFELRKMNSASLASDASEDEVADY